MAVTDLTNTTWYFNEHPQRINPNRYNLTFTSNNAQYYGIGNTWQSTYLYDLNYYTSTSGSGMSYAYESTSDASQVGLGAWSNQEYRTITITGGTDATNSELIAWLEASATQVTETETTETMWLLNADASTNFPSSTVTYNVRFKSGIWLQSNYTSIRLYNDGSAKRIYFGSTDVGNDSAQFTDVYFRRIILSGGMDISNPQFVAWLEANATRIEIDTDNYDKLDSIISDGACSLDTGYQPSNKTHLFIRTYYVAGNQWFFGARQGTSSSTNCFGFLDNGSQFSSYFATTQASIARVDGNQPFIIDKNKNETRHYWANTSGYTTQSSASTTFSITRNLYLLGMNNGGSLASPSPKGTQFYECFIEDDGGLRGYYLPAMRKSDNAVGVYDCINQTFLTNIYTGSFLGYRAEPEEGGTITYASDNTTATLTATANSNCTFQDWTLANYTKLEYIESSGTQYIDTGFTPNQNTRVDVKFVPLSSSNDGVYVFGSGTSSTNRAFELYPWNGTLQSNYGTSTVNTATVIVGQTYEVSKNRNVTTINGVEYSNSTSTFTTPYTLDLFALHRSSVLLPNNGMKLYYAKIWDNDVLVRDFIPVIRHSDYQIGMLDLCEKKFYGNAGTGKFNRFKESDTITTPAFTYSGFSWASWVSTYGAGVNNNYVTIDFQIPVIVVEYEGKNHNDNSSIAWSFTIAGSNDNITYTDIQTDAFPAKAFQAVTVRNSTAYRYYRLIYSAYNNSYQQGRYVFANLSLSGYTEDETSAIALDDNPLTFALGENSGVIANFYVNYNVTLTYDGTLGSATYSISGSNANLVATPNSNAQFVGWYVNSVLLSTNNPYSYGLSGDVTIECRFDEVYDVTTNVDGNGAIDYTRGSDRNDVTFTVIPSTNWSFEKYVVNGVEYTTTPLTVHLAQDTSVVAYFTEDDKFHLTLSTNFDYGSIYLSDNDVYDGTVVTMWARPFPDYNFVRWSDGVTANPRSITVTANITLVAIYQRVADTNGIYQYRCYVKDQMALTDPPKAFMVVDTFDIRTDYLTNATSSLTVYSMASDVNEGDILVLYDPKGTTLYQGVINSIEDLTIDCSQMQSFYKGTWIYNVSPQDFLEHEIAVLLQDYADGKLYRSSYVDSHVAQRLGGITIDYVGSTAVNLPTELDKDGNEEMNTYDMEEFIYELYQKYNIEFDFDINFSGANYVHIRVPSYSPVKVGNNMFAIQDMLPITEIEETNRLVIFAQNKTYRTTYVATKNGIVEAPSTSVNRFNITNTEVVFSDDPVEDLIANNLPQTMFNHKIEFTLVIKNFLYEFGEFNLGGELDIYYGNDYYNSVLTGYEISKASNQNIVSVHFICGLVRKKLTQLLTLGKV